MRNKHNKRKWRIEKDTVRPGWKFLSPVVIRHFGFMMVVLIQHQRNLPFADLPLQILELVTFDQVINYEGRGNGLPK